MARRKVIHSDDIKPDNPPDFKMPPTGDIVRPAEIVQPLEAVSPETDFDEVAFNEEAITIELLPSQDENAPKSVPIWVNGKGAEVLTEDGKWISMTFLPVDQPLITKRKYVEVLARCKTGNVKAYFVENIGQDPTNHVERRNFFRYPFSVIEDKNPRGREWLRRISTGQ